MSSNQNSRYSKKAREKRKNLRAEFQPPNLKGPKDEVDPYSYRMGKTKKGSSRPSHPVLQGEPGRLDPRVYADTWEEGLPPVGLGISEEHIGFPSPAFTPVPTPRFLALLEAIRRAETGGVKDPWIRTMAPQKGTPGSSAYGPGQLIAGKNLMNFVTKYPHHFSGVDPNYLKILNDQRDMFLRYGREPNKPGYEKRWDYGGTGDPAAKNPAEYDKVWMGFLKSKAEESLGNIPSNRDFTPAEIEKIIESYRGEPRSVDPRYYKIIDSDYWP